MSRPTASTVEQLEHLIADFNHGSLDVPDGLFDRNAVFRLNGRAYDDTMGRPADDPLVRLVARGPAAYRFLSRALRYALPDACLTVGPLQREASGEGFTLSGVAHLTGTERAGQRRFAQEASVHLLVDAEGRIAAADLLMSEDAVRVINEARAG